MTDDILKLMKIISLLYYNNKLEVKNISINEEAKEILDNIELPPACELGDNTIGSVNRGMLETATWLYYDNGKGLSLNSLMQRCAVNLEMDNEYIDSLRYCLEENLSNDEMEEKMQSLLSELRFEHKCANLRELVKKANYEISITLTGKSPVDRCRRLLTELEELVTTTSEDVPGCIGTVDFNEPNSVTASLERGLKLSTGEGLLDTGLVGLNRMFGGGIQRGTLINFGGLSHMYKSGILIDLCMNLPFYNKPLLIDKKKKPLILRFTFENTVEQDTLIMYKKLYEIQNNKRCDINEVDIDKATETLVNYFASTGYEFKIESYDPSILSVHDLCARLGKFIDAGYEIHSVICDYLGLIAPLTFGDRLDTKITRTLEVVRTYCYPKGITFFNAHQLSTQAQHIYRDDKVGFASKVNTGGFYADCQSLHQKLDGEVVINIIKHKDGKSYLDMVRGKHRSGENTPEAHKRCLYQFQEFGGVIPDSGLKDASLSALPDIEVDAGYNWTD